MDVRMDDRMIQYISEHLFIPDSLKVKINVR